MLTNGYFNIGGIVVHPQLNKIVTGSRTTRLEPKVMEVLLCLYRHCGQVISRDEIMRQVWVGTFVTPDSLKRCISELRKALRDNATSPQIIETIPKRGYRLTMSAADYRAEVHDSDEIREAHASHIARVVWESTPALSLQPLGNPAEYIPSLGPEYFARLLHSFIAMGLLLGLDQEMRTLNGPDSVLKFRPPPWAAPDGGA